MPLHCRVGDLWTGRCIICKKEQTGVIITGSVNFIVDGRLQARIGDLVMASCGHIGYICTGSPDTFNTSADARVGDMTSGNLIGRLVTGSNDVETQ